MFCQVLSNKNNKNILKSKYRFYLSERYWNGGKVNGINIKIATLDFHQIIDYDIEKIQKIVKDGLIEKNLYSVENLGKIMEKIVPLKKDLTQVRSNMVEIIEKSTADFPIEKNILLQIIHGDI